MTLWEYFRNQFFFLKNKNRAKIYDCFLFFNENDLLEIRLNELKNVVDYFIILESNHTFSKKAKQFIFDSDRFKNFRKKIIYIKNQDWIKSPNPWDFEKNQRNKLIDSLINAKSEDIVILSDLDEIPKKDSIKEAFYEIYKNNKKYVRLSLIDFRYALNNMSQNKLTSESVIITQKQNISSMQELRLDQKAEIIIKDAGYHYSFVSSPEDILFKISSYSHQEYNKWPNNDINFIKQRIYNGQSNFSHEEQTYTKVKLNKKNSLKYILQNKKKYDNIIFKHEKPTIWNKIMSIYNNEICRLKKYTLGVRDKSS